MTSTKLYELRVLNGEQRGAATPVRAAEALRVGEDWSNDVVIQGAQDHVVRLLLRDDGTLSLHVDSGHCEMAGQRFAAGQATELPAFTPVAIGQAQIAVGRVGAPQWALLFGDEPLAGDEPAPQDMPSGPAPIAAAPRGRAGWVPRLLTGGAVLVGVSVGALTLAWAIGPGALSLPEQEQHLRHTLTYLGFGGLDVKPQNGQLVVTGHLDSQAQLSRLEQSLTGQSHARLSVWVNEQVVAAVADVYRLNGISAEVKSGGPGVVHVQTKEGDVEKLQSVQAKARRDVPGLHQLVAANDAPPVAPAHEPAISDPGKRVAGIVPGDPAYVVTADGTRYFEGAMLPTGHRILAILSDRVQIERNGAASTLNF